MHKKRFITESWGKSSLGERVCGRAKLLAGTLRCLRLLLTSSFEVSTRPTVGALPQTPQGTLSLDPFSRLSWSRFHAPSACSFLALRLSPCLLPQLSVKNQKRDSEFPPSLWGCEITSRSERIRQRCGRRRPCRSVRCRPDGSSRGCRRSLRPQHTDQESRCRFHPAPARSR